jgi:spore coat polysaccharide biosynthesis protein SpsF
VKAVLGIVQARMSSTRLPGKSLADVGGEPMLLLLLKRLQRARELDRIVVATTTERIDDQIERFASERACDVYRGPRDDVLRRFLDAAKGHTGPVARLTGDCPLIDPAVVDEVVRLYNRNPDCVYASNVEPRSFPNGLDVEVVSRVVLEQVAQETSDPYDREHVTTYVRRHPERFRSTVLVRNEDLSDLRWTVDTEEDLEFVREVVHRLGRGRYDAGVDDVLRAVRNPPPLVDFNGRRG